MAGSQGGLGSTASSGVVVIGAGGHAKVVIELLRAAGREVDFCIAGSGDEGTTCLGVPVLIGDDRARELWREGYRHAIVAIGNNRLRERLARDLADLGFTFVNAVSPRAVVSPSARLGVGVAVMAGAVINAEAVIGDHVIINTLASVDHDCVIGAASHVAPHCGLAGGARVGDRVFLGIGSTVLPEISIGPDVQVGAGSVVIRDIAVGTVVGVPARPIGNDVR